MSFDFDKVIDRHNTGSIKYDFAVEHDMPADVLPLWIADMDFQAPPCVTDALKRAVEHGIFGYSDVKRDYDEVVIDWFRRHFGWEPQPEWIVRTPGVVFALSTAVRAYTQPGDKVLIQPPVYYPFTRVVLQNGRTLVENPLVYENGKYHIDFADFEEKILANHVKLFILCSPHNPICRVWTAEELKRMGDICRRHGVTVVSDEIHCDFAFPEHPHTPFVKACPEMTDRCIVCTAPSKTFNLAGLQVSNIFIPDAELRSLFSQELGRTGYSSLNTLGLAASRAAYADGEAWLDACRTYLRENLDLVRDYLREHIPQIQLVEAEGTYFAWLDCSGLGLTPEELEDLIVHKAKLWLDSGAIFGKCAEQFQRVVLACPRETLRNALDHLKTAVDGGQV